MAEPLKNQFGEEIPEKIAGMILAAYPAFDSAAFIRESLDGYEPLSLTQRGWRITHALRQYLPDDYVAAVEILVASLGPKLDKTEGLGMEPFVYSPHVFFVAEYGLDHYEASMLAQYELTQRFTAEFSIRPFLERYQESTLARLEMWTKDPGVHVRRLVSEGTRPRLPWAPRLRGFMEDPKPILALLELLKDDPELYVRRSVANNLNDIGKDHPTILADTTRRWMKDATPERRWLIRHALRSAVKRGEPGALAVLGFDEDANVSIRNVSIEPKRVVIGGSVAITFRIANKNPRKQRVLVDLQVHFIKASGKGSAKVFKLKAVELAPHEVIHMQKTISLANMTTRKHYPGLHKVEVLINGSAKRLGAFELAKAQVA